MAGAGKHALVVGGTGMLRGLVLHLVSRGFIVTVIARDAARLAALAKEVETRGGAVVPIAQDYVDDEALHEALTEAIAARGPFTLAVLWLRPGAPHALDTIARCADAGGGEAAAHRCRFFRILGSAAADPALVRRGKGERFRAMEGLAYREIILGFRIEGDKARWNTNEEIASGVIEAVEKDLHDHVIGVVRPWEMRPSTR